MSKPISEEKSRNKAVNKVTKGKKATENNRPHKRTLQNSQQELSHTIAFWGLAILLFLPPYFRGLFFPLEQEWALVFAVVIFWIAWLWKWSKRDNGFLSHPLDYLVLAFPVVYLVSAFQAANYGLAVNEVVKTALYFLVYWLASKLVRNEKDIITLLHVIYISTIGVALAGLATATGIIHINDGFLNGRIYSTLQYPNALASYLASVTFIGFYLWRRTGLLVTSDAVGEALLTKGKPFWLKFNRQYIYAAANFLLFSVFLGTKSQGGLLVFAVIFFLFIIGLPRGSKVPVVTHFILIGSTSFAVIWQFLSAVADSRMGLAWLWVVLGLALALVGQVLYSFIERKGLFYWIVIHRKIVLATVLIVAISGCLGAGIYISAYGEGVNTLTEQIKFRNATERMYFFQDAMKMFMDRPILGWGGGGWQEAYRVYQSYFYNSNQVHGHYFQIMVETGLLGLITIMGIWIVFLYIAHRLYHKSEEDNNTRFLVWTITIAALFIGIHAVIDFDLSLSSLALVLWVLFGFARGIGIYSRTGTGEKKSRHYVPPNNSALAVVSVASVILILFTGTLAVAGDYAKQAKKYLGVNNLNQGVELLQKASAYNPFNAEYHSMLASIYQTLGKYDEGIAEEQKAVILSKYNATYYSALAILYFNGKKDSVATVNIAEKVLLLAPFQIEWYEFLANTYFAVGYNELISGNREVAKQYFEKAVDVPDRIKTQMDSLNETEKKLWRDAPVMTVTPAVKLNVGASKYLLGRLPEAEADLQAALEDEKIKNNATLWLAVLRDKQGRSGEAQQLLTQIQELAPELAKEYEGLRRLEVLP